MKRHRWAVEEEEWRDQVDVLARYNGEVARGLVHTAEWIEQMAKIQKRFNETHGTGRRIEEGAT